MDGCGSNAADHPLVCLPPHAHVPPTSSTQARDASSGDPPPHAVAVGAVLPAGCCPCTCKSSRGCMSPQLTFSQPRREERAPPEQQQSATREERANQRTSGVGRARGNSGQKGRWEEHCLPPLDRKEVAHRPAAATKRRGWALPRASERRPHSCSFAWVWAFDSQCEGEGNERRERVAHEFRMAWLQQPPSSPLVSSLAVSFCAASDACASTLPVLTAHCFFPSFSASSCELSA